MTEYRYDVGDVVVVPEAPSPTPGIVYGRYWHPVHAEPEYVVAFLDRPSMCLESELVESMTLDDVLGRTATNDPAADYWANVRVEEPDTELWLEVYVGDHRIAALPIHAGQTIPVGAITGDVRIEVRAVAAPDEVDG